MNTMLVKIKLMRWWWCILFFSSEPYIVLSLWYWGVSFIRQWNYVWSFFSYLLV